MILVIFTMALSFAIGWVERFEPQAASALPKFGTWPLPYNLGGFVGDYGLRFKYFKIAANAFNKKKLLAIKNIVSTSPARWRFIDAI